MPTAMEIAARDLELLISFANANKSVMPGPVYNVQGYGASGKGEQDDAPYIQKALDEAAVTGGIVYVPDGVYLIKSSLSIYRNTTLQLSVNAIIKRGANLNPMILNGERSSDAQYYGFDGHGNIRITGGTLDASGDVYQGVTGQHIALGHGQNIIIDNVRFLNAYDRHAIEINGCKDVRIVNCDFIGYYGDRSTGFREAIQIDYMYVGGSWPSPPWFGALDDTVSENIWIDGCFFKDYQMGIGSHGSTTTPYEGIIITNCVFEDIDRHCIRGQNWKSVVISDIICRRVGDGIELYAFSGVNSGNVTISDVVIDMTGITSGNPGRGMFINGNLGEYIEDVSISNVTVTGASQEGIRCEYVRNAVISGVNVKGSGTQGLTFSTGCQDIVLGDSEVYDNGGHGIVLFESSNIQVSNCKSFKNGNHGLFISIVQNSIIDTCQIHSNNQNGGSSHNIRIEGSSSYNVIRGCHIRKGSETNMPAYAISLASNSANNVIADNDLYDGGNTGILDDSGNVAVITSPNRGYASYAKGSATFSGDANQTSFLIPHGLAKTPTYVNVAAGSTAARIVFFVDVDPTNINVQFSTPPASGSNNVTLYWEASCY